MENPSQPSDKVLICKDCDKPFTFTAGEQAFYASRTPPLNPPKRCGMCRYKKKERYKLKEKENYDRPNNGGEGRPTNTQPSTT